MLLMTSLTNSGLKPFYTEISLKNGRKRTSDYLDVRSNTLFEWLVRIWLTFFAMKTNVRLTHDTMQPQVDLIYLSSQPWLLTQTMVDHRVNRTFILVNFLFSRRH